MSSTKLPRPSWEAVAGRFSDSRDCLASFIALESAEVLSGVKPANLLSIANRSRSCGRNLYELWKLHGPGLTKVGGLAARVLLDRGDSLLLLIYRPDALRTLLCQKKVAVLLGKIGYRNPGEPDEVLDDLEGRCSGKSFPHEVGIFLGYPLKDVMGFMGLAKLPYTCQGPWKIYGDPDPSLQLADACRQCRLTMARRLASCSDPKLCLKEKRRNQARSSV